MWPGSTGLLGAHLGSGDADEFIVHEHFADESPRVVVLADRRPSMGIRASALRPLDKPQALLNAIDLIRMSAKTARSLTGYVDHADGEVYWKPPRSERFADPGSHDRSFHAPADAVTLGLQHLRRHRRELPTQAFVFVLSDFLVPPDMYEWQRASEHRWELVPVIVQDPVWERTFPDVGGMTVPFADPETGGVVPVYLTRNEAAERRREHEQRAAAITASFRTLGIEPVIVGSERPDEVLSAFLRWADLRVMTRGALR